MSNLEKLFIQIKNINDIYSNLEVDSILNSISENNILKQKIKDLELELQKSKDVIKSKEEEISNFTKSSLLASMDKQISEQKSYIMILEKKLNMRQPKQETETKNLDTLQNNIVTQNQKEIEKEAEKEAEKEVETTNLETNENTEENKSEYETVSDGKRKYYLVKRKVYKINKDNSLGIYYGKYKNGEIIKSD